MANPEHLQILHQGVEAWNEWRRVNPNISPDLKQADLRGASLKNADLRGVALCKAKLNNAYLRRADLSGADLTSATLSGANLRHANLSGANLTKAYMRRADLSYVDLSGADLSGSILEYARLVDTPIGGATFRGCHIYGAAVWNLIGSPAEQSNLIITPMTFKKKSSKTPPEKESSDTRAIVTVDDLEVAQFIHLLLNNEKIRHVISTVGRKAVLILGRFCPGRKEVLDAIADRLRKRDFLPIVFDFEKSQERDLTETIMILASLSLFVIADITNPRSAPLELHATVPNYMIPFVPIIQEGEPPFAMFSDLQLKYPWVLDTITYDTKENLLDGLEKAIIEPALSKHEELVARRAAGVKVKSIREVLSEGRS